MLMKITDTNEKVYLINTDQIIAAERMPYGDTSSAMEWGYELRLTEFKPILLSMESSKELEFINKMGDLTQDMFLDQTTINNEITKEV